MLVPCFDINKYLSNNDRQKINKIIGKKLDIKNYKLKFNIISDTTINLKKNLIYSYNRKLQIMHVINIKDIEDIILYDGAFCKWDAGRTYYNLKKKVQSSKWHIYRRIYYNNYNYIKYNKLREISSTNCEISKNIDNIFIYIKNISKVNNRIISNGIRYINNLRFVKKKLFLYNNYKIFIPFTTDNFYLYKLSKTAINIFNYKLYISIYNKILYIFI